MTELELIIDLHLQTDRQGPGSKEDTLRALEFVGLSNDLPWAIADIGCGSGGQTITLAEQGLAHITAVDLFEPLLQELNERSRVAGLSKQITTQQCSMESLPFGQESLDLIWSEGAIYNMGFLEGIKAWRKYLKEGGYLAVSEITWTSAIRPQEVEDYWMGEYAEISQASHKIAQLEQNGYLLEGYFCLSANSWLDNYYTPLANGFTAFLERHEYSERAQKVVHDTETEIAFYMKYKDYYSYGFYIARKAS